MNSGMSASVRSCPQLSTTGQDRTGQNRTLSTFDRSGRAREEIEARIRAEEEARAGEGTRKLGQYLRAPAGVQEAFDRQVRRDTLRELDLQRRLEVDHADDPHFDAQRMLASPVARRVRWDAGWQRRATRPQPKPGERRPYDRDTDPLFDVNLRDVWEQLTGEPLRGAVAACPHPDHEDRWPSCAVRDRLWFCNSCAASGSIIDLGALLYGMQPRGADFHRIRQQLLADLGMDERAAA